MKGEILRRMSMEVVKVEGLKNDITVKNDQENGKAEDEDDYLVKTIGSFGLWQGIVSVAITLVRVTALWNILSIFFLTPVNEFVCVEFSGNVTNEVLNSTCYDNCLKYKFSSVLSRSIIEEFRLICENVWLVRFTQFILMLGFLVGVLLFGWISDRFGRRKAMLQSTFLNAVFMIVLPFSTNYITFNSIRFIIGLATGGCLLICVVHVMEIIGRRYRELAGACCLIPDGLAEASLAGFAYFASNWQGYTLSYGVATCIIFVLILFVPESPRWLMANGKVDEAIKVITHAANRNKLNTLDLEAEITKAAEDLKLKDCEIVKTTYLDFFKSKSVFIMTLTVIVIWFALGMSCFGLYQYVANTKMDPYLFIVILGLIQILFSPVGAICNWKFGRRISTIGITIIIAVAMLILMFIPKPHWFGTILGVFALVCNNISFSIGYIYVSELYPTPLRNMSFAISSGAAGIGATIAPFVASLSPIWLPSLIFCIFSIIAGVCCYTLPETKGRNLKDIL